jgi:hypothetical protein
VLLPRSARRSNGQELRHTAASRTSPPGTLTGSAEIRSFHCRLFTTGRHAQSACSAQASESAVCCTPARSEIPHFVGRPPDEVAPMQAGAGIGTSTPEVARL